MTDDEVDGLVEGRKAKIAGKTKNGSWVLGLLFLLAVIVVTGGIVVTNKDFQKLFGLDTSSSEDIQRASRIDTGISTEVPAPPQQLDTGPNTIDVPEAPPQIQVAPVNAAEAERVKELEQKIEDFKTQLSQLKNQPQEETVTPQKLAEILETQRKANEAAAAEAQRLADTKLTQELNNLRLSLTPRGPSAADIEAERRTEQEAQERRRQEELARERQAEAKKLLQKQLDAESIVVDESETGVSAPGSSDSNGDNENVRELSSNEQFLQSSSRATFTTARANDLGDLSNIIVQGTIINAVLETAINTELPGNIRAQVSEPVFSLDGSNELLPAGTRLVGTFNSDISTAQNRVLVAWNRAITPQGRSVSLGGTGTDRLGRSGTRGNVDSRFLQRFGSAALITAITAIPSFLSTESDSASISSANDVANDASGDLADQAESSLEDQLTLPPIIRVPQGESIRVFVNNDLVF